MARARSLMGDAAMQHSRAAATRSVTCAASAPCRRAPALANSEPHSNRLRVAVGAGVGSSSAIGHPVVFVGSR